MCGYVCTPVCGRMCPVIDVGNKALAAAVNRIGIGCAVFSDEARDVYERLLTMGGQPLEELLRAGRTDALTELCERGLVWESVDLPAMVYAVSPMVALRRLFTDWQRQTSEQQRQIAAHYSWLEGLNGTIASQLGQGGDAMLGATLHVGREEIIGLQHDMVLGARRQCRNLETYHFTVGPTERIALPPPANARTDGVQHRTICTQALMTNEVTRELIREAVAAGEEYRVLPDLPMKLVIADDAALVPLTPAGVEAALLITAPVVLAALGDYFEMLWRSAAAVGLEGGAQELPARRMEVLRLAAAGLKDDAIARTLGLSTRSVRRHMDALERQVGASNRLALGIEAARRGWI